MEHLELTYRQLASVSDFTHYPYYGFLVEERITQPDLDMADFRTTRWSSPEQEYWLRQQVERCRDHADWFRGFAVEEELGKVSLVGSCSLSSDPCRAAQEWSQRLGAAGARKRCRNSAAYFKKLREAMEDEGVLAEACGHYAGSSRASYDPANFSGFALSDDYAPLVFVNRSCPPGEQVFTLMHELGHLLLGVSAVSSPGIGDERHKAERWCGAFAEEILVPLDELSGPVSSMDDIARTAGHYHVERRVILRRCHEKSLIGADELSAWLDECRREEEAQARRHSRTSIAAAADSASRRFLWALVNSASVCRTLMRDAYMLLGIKGSEYLELQDRILGSSRAQA